MGGVNSRSVGKKFSVQWEALQMEWWNRVCNRRGEKGERRREKEREGKRRREKVREGEAGDHILYDPLKVKFKHY